MVWRKFFALARAKRPLRGAGQMSGRAHKAYKSIDELVGLHDDSVVRTSD